MGECSRLENAGITTIATVTTVLEAEMALARGAGALVAQGPSAGGHRATFDPVAQPACQPLAVLLAAWHRPVGGTAFRKARAGSAAEIIGELT